MWESVVNNTDVEPRIDERNSANLGELHESNNICNLTYTKNTIPSHRGMVIACLARRLLRRSLRLPKQKWDKARQGCN